MLFIIIGYILALQQNVIALNIANVPWTVKKLVVTVTLSYFPYAIIFINPSLVGFHAWIVFTTLAYRFLSFKLSWRKSIFIVLTQYFISFVLNYMFGFIVNQFPDDLRFYLWGNPYIPRICIALIYALLLIVTNKLAKKKHSAFDYLISNYSLFFVGFYFLFLVYNVIHMAENQNLNNLTELFAAILFLVFFLQSLFYIKADQKLEDAQYELESQHLFMESQKNVLNELRGLRHNFKSIINTMYGLVDNGNLQNLKSYLKDASELIEAPQVTNIAENVKSVPILSGILSEKIARAEMKGITFNISIMVEDIELRQCSALDYSRAISILLDNALEAAEESFLKKVDLIIHVEDGRLENVITNSYDEAVDIERIFERGYSTKHNHSGEGLYQIRLIQEKYRKKGSHIELSTTYKNGFFKQVFRI